MQGSSGKTLNIVTPILISMAMIIGIWIGTELDEQRPKQVEVKENSSRVVPGRLEELMRFIEARYVDEVDRNELEEKVIEEVLEDLDPHSHYFTREELTLETERMTGNFEGIGVEFMILEDTIRIVSVIPGGPSADVGLMAGDKIVEIEDSIVAGVEIENREIMTKLRGEKGTSVEIGVMRDRESKIRHFTITRDKIPLESLDVAYMIDDHTGYIKLNRFSATTYREFMEALEDLVDDKGLKDLVLDLRQNPGGYLEEATKILNQIFSKEDRLLVYTEGRTVKRKDYETQGNSFFNIDKIAVIIDEGSASASEIVAGAIQDWDRGVVVGRRSFGKGLVQEQYRLSDGSALRLTVARYYTPSGRLIQRPYDDRDAYNMDLAHRVDSGELIGEGEKNLPDSTEYFTSKGRTVYGGGGIRPDIFVPFDSILFNDDFIRWRNQIPAFIYHYYAQHKSELDMPMRKFVDEFRITGDIMDDFVIFATNKGLDKPGDDWSVISEALRIYLKARLARHLYGDEAFYRVWNQEDEATQRSLEALNEKRPRAEAD